MNKTFFLQSTLDYTLIWTEGNTAQRTSQRTSGFRKKQKPCIRLRVTFVRNVGDTPVKGEPNTPIWQKKRQRFYKIEPQQAVF